MPIGMVAATVVVTTTHNRYAMVTVLAWAPLVAFAVDVLGQRVPRIPARIAMGTARGLVVALALFLIWANTINAAVFASREAIAVHVRRRGLDHVCRDGVPVVFQTRHLMYPTTNGPYNRPGRCELRYLALSNETVGRMFLSGSKPDRFLRFENEIARLHERLYDYPRVWTDAQVNALPRFLMFGWDEILPSAYRDAAAFGKAVFPNHTVTRLTEGFMLFERR